MSIGTEGFQVEVALGLLILQVWNVLSSLILILYLALTYICCLSVHLVTVLI